MNNIKSILLLFREFPNRIIISWFILVLFLFITPFLAAQTNNFIFKGQAFTGVFQNVNNNHFHPDSANISVSKDQLILKLRKVEDGFHSSEIKTTESVGYGYYEVEMQADWRKMDKNLVFGFFTWNDDPQADPYNSEIDIEYSYWGKKQKKNLQYTLQPLYNEFNQPRFYFPVNNIWTGKVKHCFWWYPDEIKFSSYKQNNKGEWLKIDGWSYSAFDAPILNMTGIPRPCLDTHLRLNLWIYNVSAKILASIPKNEYQVSINKVNYTPLFANKSNHLSYRTNTLNFLQDTTKVNWSKTTPDTLLDLDFADLDHDGLNEIITVARLIDDEFKLQVFNQKGELLLERNFYGLAYPHENTLSIFSQKGSNTSDLILNYKTSDKKDLFEKVRISHSDKSLQMTFNWKIVLLKDKFTTIEASDDADHDGQPDYKIAPHKYLLASTGELIDTSFKANLKELLQKLF